MLTSEKQVEKSVFPVEKGLNINGYEKQTSKQSRTASALSRKLAN